MNFVNKMIPVNIGNQTTHSKELQVRKIIGQNLMVSYKFSVFFTDLQHCN